MYARYQAALSELTQSVLANADLSVLMCQAVTLVADTLAVPYSVIWELVRDSNSLVLRSSVGWQADVLEGTVVELSIQSFIGTPLFSTGPVIVVDWPSETRFQQPPLLRDRGVISSLAVLIPGEVQPFGILGVDIPASRMLNDEEIHFVQVVAHILGLAISRHQLNQTFEQRVEMRTHQIKQRLVVAAQDKGILEERQRLARDLHDTMTQALYGVTLHAEAARRLLAAGDLATAADSLHALQGAAQEVLDEMRLLIFDLRPPILEQAGLPAALQARLEAVEGRANLQTKLFVDGDADLRPDIEQTLYRIAQEALNNALKHARARNITVRLHQQPIQVILEISDDGDGFDPTTVPGKGGTGLRGIGERVAQIGGQWSVHSLPGSGTHLRVEIAL